MDTPKTAKAAAGPIRRATLQHSAVAELRAMILEGELPPGSRVPEMQLCEQLGVSRTPLREALRVLAAEGLVELRPHRGAVVTPVDPTDIAAIFQVMEALEALAATLVMRSPPILIEAVAGLALLGAFGGALLGAVQAEEERVPALVTLLVTASGLSVFGVGSAFWGLLFGGAMHALNRWNPRRTAR